MSVLDKDPRDSADAEAYQIIADKIRSGIYLTDKDGEKIKEEVYKKRGICFVEQKPMGGS